MLMYILKSSTKRARARACVCVAVVMTGGEEPLEPEQQVGLHSMYMSLLYSSARLRMTAPTKLVELVELVDLSTASNSGKTNLFGAIIRSLAL